MNLKIFQHKTSWPTLMALALLTVWFQDLPIWKLQHFFRWELLYVPGILLGLLALSLWSKISRWALIGFWGVYIAVGYQDILYQANHTWLAMWLLIPAILSSQWWEQKSYRTYIRLTLGWVILLSALQKIVAGTYLDGSFISYLSYYGEPTEQMFVFLCPSTESVALCPLHAVIGWGVVVWQIIVGILLMIGVRSWWAWILELSFLIGAGIYADEINFQLLVLLCLAMVFRWRLRVWMIPLILLLLVIDIIKINSLLFYLSA